MPFHLERSHWAAKRDERFSIGRVAKNAHSTQVFSVRHVSCWFVRLPKNVKNAHADRGRFERPSPLFVAGRSDVVVLILRIHYASIFETRNRAPIAAKGIDNLDCDLSCSRSVFWLPSSMVEQLTLNQLVRGSSPRGATILSCSFHSRPCQSPGRRRIFLSRRRSSTVEHLFCKQAVAGSNPIAGSSRLPRSLEMILTTAWWCNGSTADSESVCLGSIPSRAANANRATVPDREKRVVISVRIMHD